MDQLTRREARRFLLAVQGLWPPRNLSGEAGILDIFHRLRCVQFDPIDIVGRNHEIVLQARVKGFSRKLLERLLYSERTLVEGWDKQMSLVPIEDRPYFARERIENAEHSRFVEDGLLKKIFPIVRKEIEYRGALSSLDIDNDTRMDWSWAPARAVRAAMEALWFRGELSIHHREGTRRYFDLTRRLLPEGLADPPPGGGSNESWPPDAESVLSNPELRGDWRIARRIGAVGALRAKSGDGWLGINMKSAERRSSIKRLVEKGIIVPMGIEKLNEPVYRLNTDNWALPAAEVTGQSRQKRAAVLGPLDNILWDRDLVRRIFDFDYVWEVYKPAPIRRWGYYVLPILYEDSLVARFEPGRDKKSGSLIVKRWWTEPRIRITRVMAESVAVALKALARSNGLKNVHISTAASGETLLRSLQ